MEMVADPFLFWQKLWLRLGVNIDDQLWLRLNPISIPNCNPSPNPNPNPGPSRGGERGESFPGPRDVWGAPSLKNTENKPPRRSAPLWLVCDVTAAAV